MPAVRTCPQCGAKLSGKSPVGSCPACLFALAIGVNGNQTVRTAMDSGAAYVFTGFGAATRLTLAADGSGGYFINFNGIPDLTYRLQRAPSVTGPWDTLATNTAPASGLIQHHETIPLPDAAFYRTVQP